MIGIIGALDVEIDGIKAIMTDIKEEVVSKIPYTLGKINGKDCVIAQCGIGKVNAAMCSQTMILKYSPSAIINSGVAGALSKKLNIGDIVISTNVVQHDICVIEDENEPSGMDIPRGTVEFCDEKIINIPADKALGEKLKGCCDILENTNSYLGTIATGEQFVADKKARLEIGGYFNALACEMEGGAIGQVCYRNNVPFVILRAISDNIDTNLFMDFLEFKTMAANNTINIVKKLFLTI